MRREEINEGMLLYAWTSLWGSFIIEVTSIINESPTRINGRIIKIIKYGYGYRADVPLLGTIWNFGIRSVRLPTAQELEGIQEAKTENAPNATKKTRKAHTPTGLYKTSTIY